MLGDPYTISGATPELFHKFIMNTSAEMSKASRRKQSKPNRLMADEEGAPQQAPAVDTQQREQLPASTSPKASPEPAQSMALADSPAEDTNDRDPVDLSTKSSSPYRNPASHQEKSSTPPGDRTTPPSSFREQQNDMKDAATVLRQQRDDMQMVTFPCHTCGDVFPSRAHQEQHMAEKHCGDPGVAKRKLSSPGPVFPMSYSGRLAEMGLAHLSPGLVPPMSKSSDVSKSTLSNGNGGNPMLKTTSPSVGGKGTAGTVFQREAYCDICQREFCNKYFLKTHKANIHGIIDPNDPKSVAVAAKANQAPKPTPPASESLMMPQKMQSTVKSTPSDSMDDFCEICQKHFCNKYYLKKHKVDVHNLRPDGIKHEGKTEITEKVPDGRPLLPNAPSSNGMPLPMMMPSLGNLNPTSMNNMLFMNPYVSSLAAMSMVPPMMQPPFLMGGMGGLAAGQPTGPPSNPSPEIKADMSSPPTPERGESKSPAEKGEAFCNICKKEFCNSYYLLVHRASKHGIFDDPTASALMMAVKAERENQQINMAAVPPSVTSSAAVSLTSTGSPSPPSAAGNSLRLPALLTSDKDSRAKVSPGFLLNQGVPNLPTVSGAQTMAAGSANPISFDAGNAVKQADRIVCDICNKEVCNKYFLKTHKQKVHGVSASPSEAKSPVSGSGGKELENLASKTPTNASNTDSLLQAGLEATPENLIRIGTNPESYCFLCKKDFSSKYFLRTHQLNFHGIKVDESVHQTTPKSSMATTFSAANQLQSFPSNMAAIENMQQWQSQTGGQQTLPVNLGNDKFSWRWKETNNSARVFCDICNKELCNKYFLRTHKAKIHGIHEPTTPAKSTSKSSMANNSGSEAGRMASRPYPPAMAAKYSEQAQAGRDPVSFYSQAQPSSPRAPGGASTAELSQSGDRMRDDACQVCGTVFRDFEAVIEHMRQDHSEEDLNQVLFRKTGSVAHPSQATASDDGGVVYKCDQCPFKTTSLSQIYSHETRKHNADTNTACKACDISFPQPSALLKHMRQIHAVHLPAKSQKTQKSSVSNPTTKKRRKIQCNFCSERFLNRQLCQSHIRNTHGIKIPVTNRPTSSTPCCLYACDQCRFICKSIKSLRAHQVQRHRILRHVEVNGRHSTSLDTQNASGITMQRFYVTSISGADTLADRFVELPVYEQVESATEVQVTLVAENSSDHESPETRMETTTS